MLGNVFERRSSMNSQSLFSMGYDGTGSTSAGVSVTSENALGLTALWSAISLTADTIATLPLRAYITDENGQSVQLEPQPDWVIKPDPDMSRVAFWQAYLVSMLLHGHGFARVVRSGDTILGMAVLNPVDVKMMRDKDGAIVYTYKGKPIPSRDIRSTPYFLKPGDVRGTSPIVQLAQNLGLAIALETYTARYFGSGANAGMVLSTDGTLNEEQVKDLARQVEARHSGINQSWRPMVLQGGLKADNPAGANDSNQLIESRRFAVEDIARILNVPPHLLGLPGYNSYASVEEANLQWIAHQLRPLSTKLEATFGDLLPPSQFLRFNFGALERGNISSRFTAYGQGSSAGWLAVDDIRSIEDLPLIGSPAATLPRVPLANTNIDAAGLAEMQQKVSMAKELIQVGFDKAAALEMVGLPPIADTGGVPVTLQMEPNA